MSDSGNTTPHFTSQAPSTEDIFKTQTVGLVQLDDFRKRRRDIEDVGIGSGYGLLSVRLDGANLQSTGL